MKIIFNKKRKSSLHFAFLLRQSKPEIQIDLEIFAGEICLFQTSMEMSIEAEKLSIKQFMLGNAYLIGIPLCYRSPFSPTVVFVQEGFDVALQESGESLSVRCNLADQGCVA